MTATATGGPGTVRRGRWALPARPPEEWVGPGWAALLALLLGAAVVSPLTGLLRSAERGDAALREAAVTAIVATLCATAAYGLFVQSRVAGDPLLSWLAAGPLLLHPVVLVVDQLAARPLDPRGWSVALVVLPLLVLACRVLRGSPRLLVPGLLLSGGATAGLALAGTGVATAAAAVAAAGAVVVLARPPRTPAWLWTAAALTTVPVVLLVGPALDHPPLLGALPLLLLAVGHGLPTVTGYQRQARRWRELERVVRSSRILTALLPGRSVAPEDDEGLPEPAEVQQTLDTGAVVIALQPVLRLSDGAVVGQEALARFGGRIPTDRWFRGATRYGLGLELEVLCLTRALTLLPELPSPQFLAVNVSPAALADPRTLDSFDSIDLSRVVVEVTEHEAVADYPGVRASLDRLRARGARIAVDDTGAGYASLRHVLLLQPEVIKLDTVLVRDLPRDPRKRALVVALTLFAQEVGSLVLAEGIETQEQQDALLEIGVDLGQGWHLGVPALPGGATPLD